MFNITIATIKKIDHKVINPYANILLTLNLLSNSAIIVTK